MSRQHGVGGDQLLCPAFCATHRNTLVGYLDLVVGVIAIQLSVGQGLSSLGIAITVYFALGVEIAYNVGYNVKHLRIGKILLITVKLFEILDTVFLKHIEKLKLGTRKLRLYLVSLTYKADIYVGIGAGQKKNVL